MQDAKEENASEMPVILDWNIIHLASLPREDSAKIFLDTTINNRDPTDVALFGPNEGRVWHYVQPNFTEIVEP